MKKLIIFLTIIAISISLMGCKGKDKNKKDNEKEEEIVDMKVKERERIINDNIIELLRDLNFSRGFSVSKFHANTSGGVPLGSLDYDGNASSDSPIWSAAQWGCTLNLLDGKLERNGSVISYDDTSKLLKVDTSKTGCVSLGIKGSLEYPLFEDGSYGDRKESIENWPHLIIGQSFDQYASLNGAKELWFEVTYTMNQCDRLTTYPVDENLHACQFQWFVTLTNKNETKKSYGDTMWFGFSMFDSRSVGKCPPGMCAIDGGKEDSTGLLIYMFSLDQAKTVEKNTVDTPSSVLNKKIEIKLDAIPFIKMALKQAKNKGIFEDAEVEDLVFGSTNIGFEIPGSYDCNVDIHSMNLYIKK